MQRNLKAMIEMGLCAMQEKEGRLVGIRKEVTEMIKSRVHNLQSQVAYIYIYMFSCWYLHMDTCSYV